MLDLIMKNIEWVFSGIGVAVLGAVGRWLWSSRKSKAGKTSTYSVHQTNSGGGDNVIGDKISHKE